LEPADLARVGAHPTRGDVPVGTALDLFLVDHLEGHVAQLREILVERRQA
jgi:hypothetical protein